MSADPPRPHEPICSQCGKDAEVKPFGRDGALICYDCWMADDAPSYRFTIHDDGQWERRKDQPLTPVPRPLEG